MSVRGVISIIFFKTDRPERFKTYIKCVGISENSESEIDDWITMELEEYEDETCIEPCGERNQENWIKGLSSMRGVLWNNRFDVLGGYGALLEVFDNETLIYLRGSVGVEGTTVDAIPEIKIDGCSVSVTTNVDSCGSLFSQSGQHIADHKFSETPTIINVPDSGIYIFKIGNFTKKIFIR